jgi:inorganic pyrophosphatase
VGRKRITTLVVLVLALAGAVVLWISVAAESGDTTGGADGQTATAALANHVEAPDAFTLVGPRSFLAGISATTADGSINVVVEIPAGSVDKWEVDKSDGALRWELRDGKPRKVRYLGYPGNYGMIPRTLLPEEHGGDGDPLDVIVLGPSVPRGSVVEARVVGVLRLLDDGEQDDKLLAVSKATALAEVADLQQLQDRFPGVTDIVETWFSNYKGAGRIETLGFRDASEARAILDAATLAFEARSSGS